MDRQRVFRALLAVAVVLAATVAGLLVTGVAIEGPCHDDLAFEPPQRTFSFEQSNATVRVSFENGHPITDENSARVALRVTDSETDRRATLVVGTNESGEFPLEPGETVVVANDSVPFALTDGDRVAVVWRGKQEPLPWYCLASRDGTVGPAISHDEYVFA